MTTLVPTLVAVPCVAFKRSYAASPRDTRLRLGVSDRAPDEEEAPPSRPLAEGPSPPRAPAADPEDERPTLSRAVPPLRGFPSAHRSFVSWWNLRRPSPCRRRRSAPSAPASNPRAHARENGNRAMRVAF
jgi:hypothetical protein